MSEATAFSSEKTLLLSRLAAERNWQRKTWLYFLAALSVLGLMIMLQPGLVLRILGALIMLFLLIVCSGYYQQGHDSARYARLVARGEWYDGELEITDAFVYLRKLRADNPGYREVPHIRAGGMIFPLHRTQYDNFPRLLPGVRIRAVYCRAGKEQELLCYTILNEVVAAGGPGIVTRKEYWPARGWHGRQFWLIVDGKRLQVPAEVFSRTPLFSRHATSAALS